MTLASFEIIIQEVVRRLVGGFHPERIILFGSWARNAAGPDSDADLLVVMPAAGSKREQAVAMDLALAGIPIPTDVIVVTPEDMEKYRNCSGTIMREAVREGKTLYERPR